MAKENRDSKHRPKFLFFGELPPAVVHGVSLSNKINTDILAEMGDLQIVEEKWSLKDHERFALRKIFTTLKSIFVIWRISLSKSPDLFYAILNISVFGSMKNVTSLLAVKLGNPKTKILLHVHRSDFKDIFEKNYLFRTLIRFFNWFGVRYLVLSEIQKTEVETFLDRVNVLYNAIDESEIFPLPSKNSKKPFRFLFLSNYMRDKGILDLIKAFNELGRNFDFQLDCYGGFTDQQTELQIRNLTKGKKNIAINRAVFGNEKNKVLNRANAVVLPSKNEGFPLVILESLRLNKPVIVSKVGYISEIFGDHYPLYCKPGNINSIKENLKRVVEIEANLEFQNLLKSKYNRYSLENHKVALKSIITDIIS